MGEKKNYGKEKGTDHFAGENPRTSNKGKVLLSGKKPPLTPVY